MAFTNSTPNYSLPQWLGTDYPSFINDMNPAYLKLDTTLKSISDSIETIKTAAEQAAQAANDAKKAAEKAKTAADNAVTLLVELGVTDSETAANFKRKVDNAVPKYDILASYFNQQN